MRMSAARSCKAHTRHFAISLQSLCACVVGIFDICFLAREKRRPTDRPSQIIQMNNNKMDHDRVVAIIHAQNSRRTCHGDRFEHIIMSHALLHTKHSPHTVRWVSHYIIFDNLICQGCVAQSMPRNHMSELNTSLQSEFRIKKKKRKKNGKINSRPFRLAKYEPHKCAHCSAHSQWPQTLLPRTPQQQRTSDSDNDCGTNVLTKNKRQPNN